MFRLILAALLVAQATCYSVDLTRNANSASKTSVQAIPRNGKITYGATADSVARNTVSNYAVPEIRNNANVRNDDSDDNGYVDEIPGEAGVNYPIYTQDDLPQTSFRCENQEHSYGYYADVEARCQVFHVCEANVKYTFLCPNGTIFSQHLLACDWWFNVNCEDAPASFGVNANFGIIPSTTPDSSALEIEISTEPLLGAAAPARNSNAYDNTAATRNANAYQAAPAVRSNNGYGAPAVPTIVDAARAAAPTYNNTAARTQKSWY